MVFDVNICDYEYNYFVFWLENNVILKIIWFVLKFGVKRYNIELN